MTVHSPNHNRNIEVLEAWSRTSPLSEKLKSGKEVLWLNPHYPATLREKSVWETAHTDKHKQDNITPVISEAEIQEAAARLHRFAPYIAAAFPETQAQGGILESPLKPIPQMQAFLEQRYGLNLPGQLWLKCDSHLPISGSIKARGGIYEVLKHGEGLALEKGLLSLTDEYSILNSDQFRDFFSHYAIAVGSTGNLGLSIGVMGAKLGFKVSVHMSADAKAWKKNLLRAKGVQVIEYASDYSKAVEEGRKEALQDPTCHFVDDENSRDLFLGYAVAAYRLEKQLRELQVMIDGDHPLFVYLPCGVGGGPGGITYGLKQVFKDAVHCFFAEPTPSPCMLLGMATGLHDQVSVADIGLDNRTEADGLAVGRPSRLVGKVMEKALSGIYTVRDDELFALLQALHTTENLQLEPSALAGMPGPLRLLQTPEGLDYLETHNLKDKLDKAIHIVWATGGGLVPPEVMKDYLQRPINNQANYEEEIR